MPIVARRNPALRLNPIDFTGAIDMGQLLAMSRVQAGRLELVTDPTIHTVDADFSAVELAALDALRENYLSLLAPLPKTAPRRSAWICPSDRTRPYIYYWLSGRRADDGLGTEVRMVANLAAACDWLSLAGDARAVVLSGDGFEEVARA